MPIRVQCPECEKRYNLGASAAGRRFRCKECGEIVAVPRRRTKTSGTAPAAGRSFPTATSGRAKAVRRPPEPEEEWDAFDDAEDDLDLAPRGPRPKLASPRRTPGKRRKKRSAGKGDDQDPLWKEIATIAGTFVFAGVLFLLFGEIESGADTPNTRRGRGLWVLLVVLSNVPGAKFIFPGLVVAIGVWYATAVVRDRTR